MNTAQLSMPEGFDFAAAVERALVKAFAPVAELERLKRTPYLTPQEVETLYGISARTLRRWRKAGIGPQASYSGDSPRYSHDAVRAYFNQQAAR